SEAAKELIARKCDAYVMHGDPPERIREKIADLSRRREKFGLPRMQFGVAGYVIVRETEAEAQDELCRITDVQQSAAGYQNYQQWLAGTQLEQRVSLEDYSVSNRGLRSGLVGTTEQVAERIAAFGAAGVDLLLLQFSPQLEEMERFAETVIASSGAKLRARFEPQSSARVVRMPPGRSFFSMRDAAKLLHSFIHRRFLEKPDAGDSVRAGL